jgi:hypothetical protein
MKCSFVEDGCLLGCCAVSSCRGLPTFRRCLLPPSSGIVLMMEAASTSETSVNLYRTTQRNNPEDSHLHTCRRENMKSHLFLLLPTWLYTRLTVCGAIVLFHFVPSERRSISFSLRFCWSKCDVTPSFRLFAYIKQSKAVPLHAMEAHWGRGGIAPIHS